MSGWASASVGDGGDGVGVGVGGGRGDLGFRVGFHVVSGVFPRVGSGVSASD